MDSHRFVLFSNQQEVSMSARCLEPTIVLTCFGPLPRHSVLQPWCPARSPVKMLLDLPRAKGVEMLGDICGSTLVESAVATTPRMPHRPWNSVGSGHASPYSLASTHLQGICAELQSPHLTGCTVKAKQCKHFGWRAVAGVSINDVCGLGVVGGV